ncbi:hypothetical protein [Streptomyces sp. NPDC026659]|uniref:hypothetical protein n=1 Tax=Streptomyces sp. NPDC026659 TaxID=3155123 RepID=UPI00340117E9
MVAVVCVERSAEILTARVQISRVQQLWSGPKSTGWQTSAHGALLGRAGEGRCMPNEPGALETLVLALATSLVTTVGTGWLVAPRLEARKRRIGELHQARDKFLASMLKIVSAGGRLLAVEEPAVGDPGWTDVMRDRVRSERARWMTQLDDSTMWMVDNLESYLPTWPSDVLRTMIGTYVTQARAVVISERQDNRKAELLVELTDPVWEVFGSRGWQRGPRLLPRSLERLTATLDAIGAEVDRQLDTPAPTP